MEFNYKEDSTLQWVIPGCITIHLLLFFCLILMAREGKKLPPISKVPLIQLVNVQVESSTPIPVKQIEPVKPRERVQEKENEIVPEKVTEPRPAADTPLEPSAIPQQTVSTSADQNQHSAEQNQILTAQNQHSGVTASTPELTTLQSAAELDNTEFDPVYNPKPDYPAVALNAQITGYVDVNLIINEQGKVESFSIVEIKGHPSFGIETARVLPRWKFPPPRIGGKKVRVQYKYRVNFTLN
jgi:protein TonB